MGCPKSSPCRFSHELAYANTDSYPPPVIVFWACGIDNELDGRVVDFFSQLRHVSRMLEKTFCHPRSPGWLGAFRLV
ncbi:unnamed protein product [Euphydryas editha]|uniref:C3H1-type domain-containing protein n=1 Tax=Euphydryas editha TaxID=104508 RepID=A0AAU9VAY6_EUPED|nr:unnamed protein product [Euphydryas editha]